MMKEIVLGRYISCLFSHLLQLYPASKRLSVSFLKSIDGKIIRQEWMKENNQDEKKKPVAVRAVGSK